MCIIRSSQHLSPVGSVSEEENIIWQKPHLLFLGVSMSSSLKWARLCLNQSGILSNVLWQGAFGRKLKGHSSVPAELVSYLRGEAAVYELNVDVLWVEVSPGRLLGNDKAIEVVGLGPGLVLYDPGSCACDRTASRPGTLRPDSSTNRRAPVNGERLRLTDAVSILAKRRGDSTYLSLQGLVPKRRYCRRMLRDF